MLQDSIRRLVELDPSHFHAAALPSVFGTEQAVEALMKDWGVAALQPTP